MIHHFKNYALLANLSAALYATIKDKAATALAKHFQVKVEQVYPYCFLIQL
jgi:hypothetical protein